MKIFNGRSATEEYMSTHSLTFSTPDLTLRKFALWLGELVSMGDNEPAPRLLSYIEERGDRKDSEIFPVTDDSFKPSGAVTEMYHGVSSPSPQEMLSSQTKQLESETPESDSKFCIECGNKLKFNAKFCTKCGSKQE